mgnify:CR=1 FL=1
MTPQEALKNAKALSKKIKAAKEKFDSETGEAKRVAKIALDKLESTAKAVGKKVSSSLPGIKKGGDTVAEISSFFSSPISFMFQDNALDKIGSAVSEVGGMLKKGYDFSRATDSKLLDTAKSKIGQAAATAMGGPVVGAAIAAGKKVISDSAAEAKKSDIKEQKTLITEQKKKSAKSQIESRERRSSTPSAKKGTYASAKEKDPKLDSYIAKRKKLEKGTAEYNRMQNKINAAYGKGPQREAGPTAEEKKKLENINFPGMGGSVKSKKEAADKQATDKKAANEKGKKTAEELKKSLKSQAGGMRAVTKRG